MMVPNSLERLLKSLEGHAVSSVEITREDDFLCVELSVVELGTRLFKVYWPAGPEKRKTLTFTVMWKKTVDEMLTRLDKELGEVNDKFKLQTAELAVILERMKRIKEAS